MMWCNKIVIMKNLLESGADNERFVEHGRNRLIHERMRFNKVEGDVG